MKLDYIHCCDHIEKTFQIKLFEYQKDMIRAWCEGKSVRSARCAGRSLLAKGFSDYIRKKLENNNYNEIPEVIIPCSKVVDAKLMASNTIINIAKKESKNTFEAEYCESYESWYNKKNENSTVEVKEKENISFNNIYSLTKDAIGIPILINNTCIGVVSDVNENVVICKTWFNRIPTNIEYTKRDNKLQIEAMYLMFK